ncbi:MAG: MFS transporter, partial [Caldilineaceae bacterium]|nr:MFS transporter [Caldilineaceae bacterium]
MHQRSTNLWHHRDFLKLWSGQTISMLGSSISFLALPLIAVNFLQATPWQMGIFTTMSTLPALLIGLFAGVWIDRYRRRPLLLIANIGQALLLIAITGFALSGWLRMELLYLFAFALAAFRLFFDIAYQSFLPTLIGRDHLMEGNSKLEISRSGVAIAGPGIAGALVQWLTAPIAILFDAASFLIATVLIAVIRKPEAPLLSGGREPMLRAIRSGLHLVFGNRTLFLITGALATGALFTAAVDAVMLLYLIRILELTAGLIGIIFGVGSLGFMAGALFQPRLVARLGQRKTLVLGLLLTGLGDLLIPLVPHGATLPVVLAMLFAGQCIYGVGRTSFGISQVSLRQRVT